MIEENEVCRYRGSRPRNFRDFAAPDQRGRIGTVATLQKFADNLGTRTTRESAQLVERFLGAKLRYIGRPGNSHPFNSRVACRPRHRSDGVLASLHIS